MDFEFDSKTRRQLGYRLIDQIDAYFSSLPDRPVQLPADQRTFGTLDDAMPEIGEDPGKVLDEICREMVDKGFNVPSANYFGLMNPTPTYMGVLAETLVAALNPQLATLARSQLASKIELETVRWIGERVGWPGAFNGTFTSGGNEANFSGLALALAAKFQKAVDDGIAVIGAKPVAYASAESHHSLDKSAGLVGIGRKALRRVAVNDDAQLDPGKLEQAISEDLAAERIPFCVVATAGTTNSGTVDDLVAISEVCRRHNLWLHVDGAYGAAAIFSAWVSNSDFEITVPHPLPIVTFRLKAPGLSAPELAEAHNRIVDEVTRDGQRWISETIVNGHSVLRMMVISYLTEARHLEALQTALAQAARNIMIERKSTERRFASL